MACNCPEGFELLDDGITCEKITYAEATPPAIGIPIDQNIEDCVWNPVTNTLTCTATSCGLYGLVVHENITSNQTGGTKQWPIIENRQNGANTLSLSVIPTTGPNWTSISPLGNFSPGHNGQHIRCNTPNPLVWPLLGLPNIVPSNGCLRESEVLSNVLYYGVAAPVVPTHWQQLAPWINTTPGSGWAYSVAIWPSDSLLTNFKWVGVSVCIDVLVDTTYYILMSCNNALRLSVDGELAVERNVGDGGTASFYYINTFPITLKAGKHTLYLEGFNYTGGGAFAFDVLNITLNQLLAIGSLAQIAPYRVASSLWKRSRLITIIGSGTTVTSVGQFTIHDEGAYINAPGFPTTAYITNVIDANTVQISESIPATTTSGTLYFIWDVSNTAQNAWTCPAGFLFGNCDGPECRQIELATCTPECYLLTPCEPTGVPIKVTNDLSLNLGQVVRICPTNLPTPTPTTPVQTGTPIRTNPNNDTRTTIGTLTSCCPGYDPIYTTNDSLAQYDGLTFVIPSIDPALCWTYVQGGVALDATFIDLAGAVVYTECADCTFVNPCIVVPTLTECECFTVSLITDCTNSITLILPEPLVSFTDCIDCEPVCYLLTNCEDAQETIVTSSNLEDYVGEVIKLLETCPDKCWSVTLAPDCIGSISVQQTIETFATCEACLPPVPEVPFNLKTRAVKPGFYTLGCPPKYTLAVNCKFAEVIYSQMAVKRYGITPCCDDEDTNKWLIDKEMLDLKSLYDASLCVSTLNRCCPVTCLEVTLEVFRPLSCDEPTNLVSSIVL